MNGSKQRVKVEKKYRIRFYIVIDSICNKKEGDGKITVKQKIEAACKVAGISVSELGRQMGMSQSSISKRLTTGKFTQSELEKMADILGCEYIACFKFPDGTIIK